MIVSPHTQCDAGLLIEMRDGRLEGSGQIEVITVEKANTSPVARASPLLIACTWPRSFSLAQNVSWLS